MRSLRITARSTGVIVGLTIAVLIGTGAMLAITHSNSAARQLRLVVSSYETLTLMRQAVIALQDTEVGQRAYLLSGDVNDLQPYERARLRIETELRQLEAATATDPDRTSRSVAGGVRRLDCETELPLWTSAVGCGALASNNMRRHSAKMRLTIRSCKV